MTSGVSIRNLEKSYGALRVLKDLSLDVAPGDFTVLLGPSGCGKSTLLSAIAGLDDIDSGIVEIGGRDVTRLEPKDRGIAMVFQSYALYPTMTVRGNLSFGLKMNGLARDEIARRVAWAAETLQIGELLDRKPAQLSGGQRQRVAIGRAMVRESSVFLFDEPLSNLDAKLRAEMRIEIKRLHERLGTTVVYVTHDQIEAMTMATRIAVMRQGEIEQYADPQTLYDRPRTRFVAAFIGSPSMTFLDGIFRASGNGGGVAVEIDGVRVPLDAYPFEDAADDGQPVTVGLRAEHVAPAADRPGAFAVEAPVLMTEPLGADTIGWFAFGGAQLAARLDPPFARSLGGRLPLSFDMSRASVFARDTGRRL